MFFRENGVLKIGVLKIYIKKCLFLNKLWRQKPATWVQGLVSKAESIINISRDQFSVLPLLKLYLYLVILTVSLTLNLGTLGFVSICSIKTE